MAKLKSPLLSLKASGTLARVLTFVRRGKVDLVEKKPELIDAQTAPQLAWRTMFGLCKDLWHELSPAEMAAFERAGSTRHMTGYAWYMSQCLRPNPGIYLPLAGGTMSGDIDMAGYRILNLPGFFWLSASVQVVTDLNRIASLNWTDLDLTASTSPYAKIAVLRLQIKADTITAGLGNAAALYVRKNGTTPAAYPRVGLDGGSYIAGTTLYETALVGLDASQVLEYRIPVVGTIQVDSRIQVLGYIE